MELQQPNGKVLWIKRHWQWNLAILQSEDQSNTYQKQTIATKPAKLSPAPLWPSFAPRKAERETWKPFTLKTQPCYRTKRPHDSSSGLRSCTRMSIGLWTGQISPYVIKVKVTVACATTKSVANPRCQAIVFTPMPWLRMFLSNMPRGQYKTNLQHSSTTKFFWRSVQISLNRTARDLLFEGFGTSFLANQVEYNWACESFIVDMT